MKVLWITNIYFPALCEELHIAVPAVGGWMYSMAKTLMQVCNSLHLAVATVGDVRKMQHYVLEGIEYYILPKHGDNTRYDSELEPLWHLVVEKFNPDIVHIHGTEFAHGLAFLNACPHIKSVVSIQGLVSICGRFYYGGLSCSDIIKHITLRDILLGKTLFQDKRQFVRRGKIETAILSRIDAVIGRTFWDKAHVKAINPKVHYYSSNETLRDSFYNHTWEYSQCTPNTLFVSQGHYPLKGVHEVIKAVALLVKEFPDIHLYVAGYDVTAYETFYQKIKLTGYGHYLRSLISKYNLKDHISFLGLLNEQEMLRMYLKANVYICPSSIENSPNSLCEAQLLGMPNISAYVGGIPSLVIDDLNGMLYPFGEYELLALKIKEVLRREISISVDRSISFNRHDKIVNAEKIISIYEILVKE